MTARYSCLKVNFATLDNCAQETTRERGTIFYPIIMRRTHARNLQHHWNTTTWLWFSSKLNRTVVE